MRIAEAYVGLGQFDRAFEQMELAQQEGYPIDRDTRIVVRMAENMNEDAELLNVITYVDRVWLLFKDHPDVLRARAMIHHYAGEFYTRDSVLTTMRGRYPGVYNQTLIDLELATAEASTQE
jgi:hypothetical protein